MKQAKQSNFMFWTEQKEKCPNCSAKSPDISFSYNFIKEVAKFVCHRCLHFWGSEE